MESSFDFQARLPELLLHAQNFEVACILVSNNFTDPYGRFQLVAGFGEKEAYYNPDALEKSNDLKLGFIGYDYKNKIEVLSSNNPAAVPIPDFYFFSPTELLVVNRCLEIEQNTLHLISENKTELNSDYSAELDWKCRTPAEDYYKNIESIKKQIENGDFYELNYCIEWTADEVNDFDPYAAFYKLNKTAPAPFAVFFKLGSKYLLCSSPERFLRKHGSNLISQPIKGTRKRLPDKEADSLIAAELENSEKDRAENIMITDLVRNDLSVVCKNGTVQVKELCKIYSYSHVHQMVSLITGETRGDVEFNQIVKATFPMGSMTGAPKIMVMNEIERYENFKRGWYSGAVGWYQNGDFDTNVVIRSLQFDRDTETLIYNVGGAIVYESDAEKEYEECAVKAAGILSALKPR